MKKIVLLSLTTLLMIGCSTTPDPAKICTSEWIAPRAEKAISRIEKKTRPAIKAIKSVGESFAEGRSPNIFAMMNISSSFESLEKELTQGRGIKDIKLLASTCNDPELLKQSVRGVFEKHGISDKVLDTVENLDFYKRVLEKNLEALKNMNLDTSSVATE